jgi:hypothetical protein
MQHGPQRYIANVHATELAAVRVDDVVLPITISAYHPANSYVCSPYNHYFSYGLEELGKLGPAAAVGLRLLLRPFAAAYRRSGFDAVVLVNNWLLSTNLYPPLSAEQAAAVTHFLAGAFPQRPIVWRSVDGRGNPHLGRALVEAGGHLVFSRQVYYQNPSDPALWQKKQIKVDERLARRSDYRLTEDISVAEAPRLAELYRQLYLDKYSYFNPQFTPDFFRLAVENRLFTLKAYQKSGDIEAVLGYYELNGIMTQPIFGYDTHLPQELGLYRLLSLQVLREGQARGALINASGGVGEFKRLRGGVAAIEYNGVYLRHLPLHQRRPWLILKHLLDTIAVPIIQRYGF